MPGLPDAGADLLAARALALAAAGVADDEAAAELRALAAGDWVLLALARTRCAAGARGADGAAVRRARALVAAAAEQPE